MGNDESRPKSNKATKADTSFDKIISNITTIVTNITSDKKIKNTKFEHGIRVSYNSKQGASVILDEHIIQNKSPNIHVDQISISNKQLGLYEPYISTSEIREFMNYIINDVNESTNNEIFVYNNEIPWFIGSFQTTCIEYGLNCKIGHINSYNNFILCAQNCNCIGTNIVYKVQQLPKCKLLNDLTDLQDIII